MAGFQIPQVAPKFKTLVKAMTVGGLEQKIHESYLKAMCKSLESSIFNAPVSIPSLAIGAKARVRFREELTYQSNNRCRRECAKLQQWHMYNGDS